MNDRKMIGMGSNRLSDSTVKALRVFSLVAGVLLLLAAAFANPLGLSVSGGLSRNQIVIGLFGMGMIAAALLGRKFPGCYRGLALILLNTVLLLLLLDLASLVVVKIIDAGLFRAEKMKMEDGNSDLARSNLAVGRYAPYVVWRADPDASGEGVTVSGDGHRVTPGNPADADAYTVFLFGGSSMWGTGVADTSTIPFHLRELLREDSGLPVRTLNFGQMAFSSTQEVIELMLQLREGNIPDLVIFYDGFNDIWNAWDNGFAGGHHAQARIAERIEGRAEGADQLPLLELIARRTNIWMLLQSLNRSNGNDFAFDPMDIFSRRTMNIRTDSLAVSVVHIYLGNCRVVEALGEAYGFHCLFVWQPAIWLGDKPLTEHEQDVFDGGSGTDRSAGSPMFKELFMGDAYAMFQDSISGKDNYLSFSNIFQDESRELYTDYSGCHVNSLGNELIARSLAGVIIQHHWIPKQSEPLQ